MMSIPILLASMAATSQVPPPNPKEPSWFIFLVRAATPPKATSEEIQTYQNAHIGNFKRLWGEGKILTAGPLEDPTKFKRGIVVFTVKTENEVKQEFNADPYVSKGFMNVQALPIKTEFGRFNTKDVDPNGIVENRIAVFSPAEGSRAKPDWESHRKFIAAGPGNSELAYFGRIMKPKEIAAVALFRGKDDNTIKAWIDSDPLVKSGYWTYTLMPQWLSKGIL